MKLKNMYLYSDDVIIFIDEQSDVTFVENIDKINKDFPLYYLSSNIGTESYHNRNVLLKEFNSFDKETKLGYTFFKEFKDSHCYANHINTEFYKNLLSVEDSNNLKLFNIQNLFIEKFNEYSIDLGHSDTETIFIINITEENNLLFLINKIDDGLNIIQTHIFTKTESQNFVIDTKRKNEKQDKVTVIKLTEDNKLIKKIYEDDKNIEENTMDFYYQIIEDFNIFDNKNEKPNNVYKITELISFLSKEKRKKYLIMFFISILFAVLNYAIYYFGLETYITQQETTLKQVKQEYKRTLNRYHITEANKKFDMINQTKLSDNWFNVIFTRLYLTKFNLELIDINFRPRNNTYVAELLVEGFMNNEVLTALKKYMGVIENREYIQAISKGDKALYILTVDLNKLQLGKTEKQIRIDIENSLK